MILAHKIALDVTEKQRKYFFQAAGCDRFVWNIAVAEWNRQYVAFKRGEQAEKPTGSSLKKAFNEQKYEAFPWLEDIHRDAHADAFDRLAKAWSRYFSEIDKWRAKAKELKAERAAKGLKPWVRKDGRTHDDVGKPDFHRKGEKDSFYVANDKFKVVRDKSGSQVKLPVIGLVRMREDLRWAGKITGAVVSRHGQRWLISIQVDVPDKQALRDQSASAKGRVVGVDLGLKTAAVIHDGEKSEGVEAPKPLKKALKKLRREQRKMARRRYGDKNLRKIVKRVQSVHARVVDVRKDWLNKLTTRLCRENQAVVIENLNVAGMMRNEKLARAISDISFGEFRRQMEYKAKLYKTHLVIVDRWFPSSKTCSECGAVKEDLTLAERVFHCGHCGYEADRDENAAVNLRNIGLALLGRDTAKRERYSRLCEEFTPEESAARKGPRRIRN